MSISTAQAQHARIPRPVARPTPLDKLLNGLMAILTGAQSLVEAGRRARSDRALRRAIGRNDGAEATAGSATQHAMTETYVQHSAGHWHGYGQSLRLLDIDMTLIDPNNWAPHGELVLRPDESGH